TQQRWEDLADVLDRRTSGPSEALPLGPERRAKLRELASLYEERLEKPYEAIDTLERFVAEAAEEDRERSADAPVPDPAATLDALDALERMYSRVGLWAKVVESLQRHADLTTDAAAARTLRLRVAHVYEKELGQSERA